MIDLDKLSGIEILDQEGAPIRVGELWKEKTTVLVFVRHFG